MRVQLTIFISYIFLICDCIYILWKVLKKQFLLTKRLLIIIIIFLRHSNATPLYITRHHLRVAKSVFLIKTNTIHLMSIFRFIHRLKKKCWISKISIINLKWSISATNVASLFDKTKWRLLKNKYLPEYIIMLGKLQIIRHLSFKTYEKWPTNNQPIRDLIYWSDLIPYNQLPI